MLLHIENLLDAATVAHMRAKLDAAEWVDGWYEAYPRGPNDVLPKGVPDRHEVFSRERHVYRGGSWNTFSKYLRCANREHTSSDMRWVYVGFRCAQDPPWKTKP